MDEDPIIESLGDREGETSEVGLDAREVKGAPNEALHLGDYGVRVHGSGGNAGIAKEVLLLTEADHNRGVNNKDRGEGSEGFGEDGGLPMEKLGACLRHR